MIPIFSQNGALFGRGTSNMSVLGFSAGLHMPQMLKSQHGGYGEVAHGLPPYAPRAAFQVDTLPNRPANWPLSGPGTASFVVPVMANSGMWFELNDLSNLPFDTAVMVNVQGVNAITGERFEPILKKADPRSTGPNTPPQNYLATTGTPAGLMWLDGWRMPDGTVRQFFFTEDETRGVAANLIGDARTHHLELVFFRSVATRPPRSRTRGFAMAAGASLESFGGVMSKGIGATRGGGATRSLELGAGAKIEQKVYADPNGLDFWILTPAARLIVCYAPEAVVLDALGENAGQFKPHEGFLTGVPVGA